MQENIFSKNQKQKKNWKTPKPKTVVRFQSNATRLEHRNVKGKNNV